MANPKLKNDQFVNYVLQEGDGVHKHKVGAVRRALIVGNHGKEVECAEGQCVNLCVFIDGTNDKPKAQGKEDLPAEMVMWVTSAGFSKQGVADTHPGELKPGSWHQAGE